MAADETTKTGSWWMGGWWTSEFSPFAGTAAMLTSNNSIYIYIYIYRERERDLQHETLPLGSKTPFPHVQHCFKSEGRSPDPN